MHCFQLLNWFKGPKNAMTRAGVWIHILLNNNTLEESSHVFLDFRGLEYGRMPLVKAERFSSVIPQTRTQCSLFQKTPSFTVHSRERKLSNCSSVKSLNPPRNVQKRPTRSIQSESSFLFPTPANSILQDPDVEREAQSYLQPFVNLVKK